MNCNPNAVVLACRTLLAIGALMSVEFSLANSVCAKDLPKYVGDFPPPRQQSIQIIDDGPVVHDYRHAPIIVVPERPEGARPPLGMPIPAGVKSSKSEVPTAVKVNPTADFEPPIFKFPPDLLPRSEARSQSKVAPKQIVVQDQTPVIFSQFAAPPVRAGTFMPYPRSRASRIVEQKKPSEARLKIERVGPPAGSVHCDFPLPKLSFPRETRWPVAPQTIPMTASPNALSVPAK